MAAGQTAVSATPPAPSSTSIAEGLPDAADETLNIRHGRDAWATARSGLWTVYISVAVLLASVTLSQSILIGLLISDPDAMRPVAGPPRANTLLFGLANAGLGCLMFIVMFAGFVGMVLVAMAPDPTTRKRATLTIVGLVGMVVVSIGLGIYLFIVLINDPAIRQQQPQDPQVVERMIYSNPILIGGFLVAIGMFLTASTFWFLAHASIAVAVNDLPLRGFALRCLFICLAVIAVSACINGWLRIFGPGSTDPTVLMVSGGCGLISNLIVYGVYLILCRRTIRAISAST